MHDAGYQTRVLARLKKGSKNMAKSFNKIITKLTSILVRPMFMWGLLNLRAMPSVGRYDFDGLFTRIPAFASESEHARGLNIKTSVKLKIDSNSTSFQQPHLLTKWSVSHDHLWMD